MRSDESTGQGMLWPQSAYTPQKGELAVSCSGQKEQARDSKIRKAIKQGLGHLTLNLASVDALIGCFGNVLAPGGHTYQKLLVISELVRYESSLYLADNRSIHDCIGNLFYSHIRSIVP